MANHPARVVSAWFTLFMACTLTVGCAAFERRPVKLDAGGLETVRSKVAARFSRLEAPGAVFGLYRGEELDPLLIMPLGYADEQHSRPIMREDHFRIASITKMFVGTVVLQLVDEGRIKLDDPVAQYVPGVPGGERISIAMLGYHTSGLPREIAHPDFQQAIQADPSYQWTPAEILAYSRRMKTLFPPGKGWTYSNTNTILLGEVIHKVTGKPWHEVVQERIIMPLRLDETGYPVNSQVPEPTPRGYRFGQKDNLVRYGDFWFDATSWSGSCWGAAGDMYSTVDDLARFVRPTARGELVGAQSRKALFAWVNTGYDGIEYGFHIARRDGAIGSSGDIPGFSAFAAYLPERDLTIICLANLTATRNKLTAAAELGELAVHLLRP